MFHFIEINRDQMEDTDRYKDGLAFFYRQRFNQETNQVLHFIEIDCDQMKDTELYKDDLASFFYRLRYNQKTNQVLQAKC